MICRLLLIVLLPAALDAHGSALMEATLAAQDAITAGDLDTASRLIEASIKKYPNDGGLLNLRGVVHARRDELPEARKDFALAVQLVPRLTPAWQNLGRACLLLASADPTASSCAADAWKHVSTLKPGDSEAHASLGLLYERQAKFRESLDQLDGLPPDIASKTPNLLVRCADLTALGRTAQAQNIAGQLASREDFSEPDFEEVRNAFDAPAGATVVVLLGEALDNRHAAGLASLRQLAIAYEELHRPTDARKTLERVAALDPKNLAHLLELARLADLAKDYEGALGYLGHARDLDPENARIHFLFATTALKLQLPVEARRSLDRALALDPNNPDYNYAMGAVILTTRDAATASSYIEKFVQARPENPAGHFALGVAWFRSGDYDKAKSEMMRLENGPKRASAEYFLGRIARIEGSPDEALRRLRISVELMPAFAESHTELARVYMLQGDLRTARVELRRAVELDPQSFEANNQLLVLYKRTHDPRAANQQQLLAKLDEERSRRAELMLRTVEARP